MARYHQRRRLLIAFAIVALVIVVLVLAGCGDKSTEPFRDAPRGDTNSDAADTITFPDGFSNVAAKCDGTTRVYSGFKGDENRSAIAVSPDHPACTGR